MYDKLRLCFILAHDRHGELSVDFVGVNCVFKFHEVSGQIPFSKTGLEIEWPKSSLEVELRGRICKGTE
jgi:hypothetical protein